MLFYFLSFVVILACSNSLRPRRIQQSNELSALEILGLSHEISVFLLKTNKQKLKENSGMNQIKLR